MADDKEKHSSHGGGGHMADLRLVILVLVVAFIIWVWAGGPQKSDQTSKPFIKPYTDQTNPGQPYGPSGN